MSTNLIYKNTALCELVNRLLYGRHYTARFRAIADLIPAESTVVDLCCGPAVLYHQHLRQKSVRYTGIDQSPLFIDALHKQGVPGILCDLRDNRPLPTADYLVIQGALYFFLPNPSALINRMLAAANRQVIVAESIRNLSSSRIPLISNIAMQLAGAVKGDHPSRFTEETLDKFFNRYSSELKRSFKIPGGRDKIHVLEKTGTSAVVR